VDAKYLSIGIFGEIGMEYIPGHGHGSQAIRSVMRDVGHGDAVRVRIHSYGGCLDSGIAIYHVLVDHCARVHVDIGVACGAASVIAMASDPGCISIDTKGAFTIEPVLESKRVSLHGRVNRIRQTLKRAYMRHSTLSRPEIRRAIEQGASYGASAAIDAGFAQKSLSREDFVELDYDVRFGFFVD
jgi:ATP-dependent protease ClpP protease subunit